MRGLTRRSFCLAIVAFISLLAACQKAPTVAPELPDVKVGVVGVVQPMGTTDLLAGFNPGRSRSGRAAGAGRLQRGFDARAEDADAPFLRLYPQGGGR